MIAIHGIKLFVFVIISCLFHELAHFLAMKIKNLPINQLNVTLVGGSIKCYALNHQSNLYLVIIYAAGIFANLLLGYLCYFIAINGFYSRNFFILSGINYLLAIFNSLPIKILDGYFILKHFLLIFFQNHKKVENFCNFISLLCNSLLIILGFLYIFQLNFSIFIISLYLLIKSLKNSTHFW